MDSETLAPESPVPRQRGLSGLKLFAIVFGAVLLALLLAALAIRIWLFPAPFEPVSLRPAEQATVNAKLQRLGYRDQAFALEASTSEAALEPQPYSEAGATREVRFSEREINALLAKNTALARKLAIDLADDLASARLVLPLDPDFPFLGGQTLRMSAGVEIAYRNERPLIVLKGVSIWGVPLPAAWLGNLKNVDLVAEFGDQDGFWKQFADGIAAIEVRQEQVYIKLKE